MKANDLHNFRFEPNGYGCYKVTYYTENRGDYYTTIISDMTIIDATKNAEWAKVRDIEWLRHVVIVKGRHYSSKGKKL